jgi:hypothetical protein
MRSPRRWNMFGRVTVILCFLASVAFVAGAQAVEVGKELPTPLGGLSASPTIPHLESWSPHHPEERSMLPPEALDIQTMAVDCAAGESIEDALAKAKKADGLVVSISGMCEENVTIERDHVALLGGDPEADGIRGVSGIDAPAIRIKHGYGVVLENLTVEDGDGGGVRADWSSLTVRNCRIRHNELFGVYLSGATAWFWDVAVSENSSIGVRLHQAAALVAEDSVFNDNVGYQVAVVSGSRTDLHRCSIEGSGGLDSELGSFIYTHQTSVLAVEGRALSSTWNSQVFMANGELSGSVAVFENSGMDLSWVDHTSNASVNQVSFNSYLAVDVSTHLLGPVIVSEFSTLTLTNDSVLDGDLLCGSAGDAFADDPATQITGSIVGCDHATK